LGSFWRETVYLLGFREKDRLERTLAAYRPFGYQLNTSKKQTKYLSIFTELPRPLWHMDIHLAQ
jgi:hypothetical protein